MNNLQQVMHFLLHIDIYLNAFLTTYGFWTYFALFAVIFCETALVVTPFLPGDSLLFAAGSLAAQNGNPLEISLLFCLLFIASVSGNQVNYLIGKALGPRVFKTEQSWLFNKKYLTRTHLFYEKHGGKTLILARFMPIIRTFAPFIAGIGAMNWLAFTAYNLIGAMLWVGGLLASGYFLGSIPLVKTHFSLVVYCIIAVSLLPALITGIRSAVRERE